MILPDADDAGREGAQRALHILKNIGVKAQIKDLFPGKTNCTDLADHLINYLQNSYSLPVDETSPIPRLPLAHPLPEEKVQNISVLFNKHPVLWQLTEQLGLEITG